MKLSKTLKLTLKNILLDVKMGEIVAKENTLIFDGEEYSVGTEVFVKDAENEGEVIVAPDGDYTLIEEDTVKVIVVREGKIEDIKDEETEKEEEKTEETSEEVKAEEVIVEPADEDKEEEEKTEDTTEEKVAELEEKLAALVEGFAEIQNKLAAAEGRIATLEEKLAAVEAPAAEPAEEEKEETKMSRLSYLKKK